MLEIIAIIMLSRKNGNLAASKGLKSSTWVWYTVLAWVGFELAGALYWNIIVLDKKNRASAYILAIGSAIMGYFVIRQILLKKSDSIQDDIDRIGVNDLYPDKNKDAEKQ